MHITVPAKTDVTISGDNPSPVEVLAQLQIEIEAVVDETVDRRLSKTARGEQKLTFECLDGDQPSVDVVIKSNGLFQILRYEKRGELPPQVASSLDDMATLVVRFFRNSKT